MPVPPRARESLCPVLTRGPSAYEADALPLSYRGTRFTRRAFNIYHTMRLRFRIVMTRPEALSLPRFASSEPLPVKDSNLNSLAQNQLSCR